MRGGRVLGESRVWEVVKVLNWSVSVSWVIINVQCILLAQSFGELLAHGVRVATFTYYESVYIYETRCDLLQLLPVYEAFLGAPPPPLYSIASTATRVTESSCGLMAPKDEALQRYVCHASAKQLRKGGRA